MPLLALLLAACSSDKTDDTASPADDTADTTDTGGGTGGDMPAYCAEDHRTEVTDLSVPAEGFAFSPQAAIDTQIGTFAGPLTRYDKSGTVGMTLDVTFTGKAVAAVYRVLIDPSGGEGSEAADSGPTDCPPVYEYGLNALLGTSDGSYTGALSALVLVAAPGTGNISASLPIASFTGSAQPSFDTTKWASVTLEVDAAQVAGGWAGSMMWLGSNESGGPAATADTGTDTGTAEPSGVTEGIGGFALTRTKG